MHTLKLNEEYYFNYTWNDCVASIRAAWSWGYYEHAEIDDVAVTIGQLEDWGCY